MGCLSRTAGQWSVTTVGFTLLLLTLVQILPDTAALFVNFPEIFLPFVVSLGLTVGGIWLAKTQTAGRSLQIAWWMVGSSVVGIAVTRWFLYIIPVERMPADELVVLTLNSGALCIAAGAILGYHVTALEKREQPPTEHTSRITELHDIATEIVDAETQEIVYQRAADGAAELFAADVARVAVPEGERLVLAASSSDKSIDDWGPVSTVFRSADRSFRSNTVNRVEDPVAVQTATTSTIEDGASKSEANLPSRTLLSIPLAEYGVIQLFASEPRAFSEQDEEVAELFATYVISALQQLSAKAIIRQERDHLEEFTSVLSHDLRNPLNVAQGHLELAETMGEDEHLRAVESALERMEQLIEELLTLAREGDTISEIEPVALGTIATQAWDNVMTDPGLLKIDSSVQLKADRSRLIQVFENLYRNAIECAGENVTIRVGTFENGFYIEDSGPGIPEDRRSDIFEIGYTTCEDGTGFGLAIAKRIIEAHGWEIDVTTGTDGGARFEISGL